MFPPAKNEADKPLGDRFDIYLSRHSQQEEKSAASLGSGSDDYALEEFYDQPFAPPEPAEPFDVIPSDSEEREEEGKVVSGSDVGRFGK